jgi:hypothetical protein
MVARSRAEEWNRQREEDSSISIEVGGGAEDGDGDSDDDGNGHGNVDGDDSGDDNGVDGSNGSDGSSVLLSTVSSPMRGLQDADAHADNGLGVEMREHSFPKGSSRLVLKGSEDGGEMSKVAKIKRRDEESRGFAKTPSMRGGPSVSTLLTNFENKVQL